MSAPVSRFARQMRPHLGAGLWGEFVAHANRHYKARWLRAFAPGSGVLRCVGVLDGAPCAHAALVDLRAGAGTGVGTGERGGRRGARAAAPGPRAAAACDVHRWRAAMRAAPRSWDDWTAALCHDLFGVCERGARRRVCALPVWSAARRRGCGAAACGPRVPTAVDRSWARLVVVGFLWTARRFVFLFACRCVYNPSCKSA